MMDMYSAVLPGMKAKTFVDQIFQRFDSDNSGSIDFKVNNTVENVQIRNLISSLSRNSC